MKNQYPVPIEARGAPAPVLAHLLRSAKTMSYNDSQNPPVIPSVPAVVETGDATGGVIPYKNPHALAAYYLGVFSVIPIFGLIAGSIAVPLGISGLRERKKKPIVRGAIHAWFGIVVGGCSVAVHLTLITIAIVAIATGK